MSRALRSFMPWASSPSPMMSLTGIRGFSDPNGSWKMICIFRRSGRSSSWLSVGDVAALELDRSRRRLDQAEDRPAKRRLAAAGLADEAEDLARADVEVDAVDRVDRRDLALEEPAQDREVLLEPADLEDRRLPRRRRAPAPPSVPRRARLGASSLPVAGRRPVVAASTSAATRPNGPADGHVRLVGLDAPAAGGPRPRAYGGGSGRAGSGRRPGRGPARPSGRVSQRTGSAARSGRPAAG